MADPTVRAGAPVARDGYTAGYTDEIIAGHRRRTLDGCAPFLLPHLRPGLAVLDCGCGAASMTVELAERVAPGPVVGVDVEPGQVAQAAAFAAARGASNARFEVGDAYALPFPDASFDVVFSHALVSHLAEPERAFAEMRRVLKPGGLAAVAENDSGTFVVSPAGSAMERFVALHLRVLGHNGGDRLRARHLRGALLAAGFAWAEGYAGHAEADGAPEATRRVAAMMASVVRRPDFARTVLERGWASGPELEALPGEMLAWGERADAFWASLKCGALGWTPEELGRAMGSEPAAAATGR
jgi:ubiquinone/menaquinone biosynthesis C-methylase UbiE